MSRSVIATVDPALLVWARESAHFTQAQLAKALNCTLSEVQSIERGEHSITVAKLRTWARKCKRPLSAFYVAERPSEPSPPDFRRPVLRQRSGQTRLYFAIRKVRELLADLVDAQQGADEHVLSTEWLPKHSTSERDTVVGASVRAALGCSWEEQRKWRQPRAAFNAWRQIVEDLGIPVLVLPFSPKLASGFSLRVDDSAAIAICSKDHPSRRVFTLFHELMHVSVGGSGLCSDTVRSYGATSQPVERFCNRAAAEAIVPKSRLREAVKEMPEHSAVDLVCRALSQDFGVSNEVILHRLLEEDLIDYEEYIAHLRILRRAAGAASPPKSPGGNYFNVVPAQLGTLPFRLIGRSIRAGTIDSSKASNILGVPSRHLERFIGPGVRLA